MKSIVTNNINVHKYDGVAGVIAVTTSNGTVDIAQTVKTQPEPTTPDIIDFNAKKGLFVSESTEIDAGGVPVEGGGIIFVSGGKLKYRGSTGTITTVADA
jgi:hypothetical protein